MTSSGQLLPFDLVVQGGTVIDGTGAARSQADVAIMGDRIAAIGNLTEASARDRYDATGLIVAPGFIDAHTHDDRAVLSGPDMTMKISQGVTTVVSGNCGVSLAPFPADRDPPPPLNLLGGREWFRFRRFADYIAAVEATPAAVNIAPQVGHTTLRAAVMDNVFRPADDTEIGRMGELVDEAMAAGAIGISTGLFYPPANAAPTAEVVALACRAAGAGGLHTTHMRDEGARVLDSIQESAEIGKSAGLPVVVSHHKCTGRPNWGRSVDTLALIEDVRRQQTLDIDVYPYVASSTVLLPSRVRDAERVMVTWSRSHPEMNGRDLADVARQWNCSQEQAAERLQPAGAIYWQMDEQDLRRILRWPDSMIGSDGLPHDDVPHPRLWGTFPRVLGHYARDQALFSLEQAVRKMTSITAHVFGLKDRGTVAVGSYADLTIFDAASVIDTADFNRPKQTARGIRQVIVNGQPVWQGDAWTGAKPGRVLRRTA
jgi:N-acyl-D-amino-acid deacylase